MIDMLRININISRVLFWYFNQVNKRKDLESNYFALSRLK